MRNSRNLSTFFRADGGGAAAVGRDRADGDVAALPHRPPRKGHGRRATGVPGGKNIS